MKNSPLAHLKPNPNVKGPWLQPALCVERWSAEEPPVSLGALTVADVDAAVGIEAHQAAVRAWAAQMWAVWSPHHARVRAWASAA